VEGVKMNKPARLKQGKYIDKWGTEEWYLNGRYHREDGPAITFSTGTEYWFLNGLRHRTDGPAVVFADGTECWFINGLRHRTDGPAIIYSDGSEYWFLDDKEVDPMIVLIQEVEALDETR
jgi:hypothetical protein